MQEDKKNITDCNQQDADAAKDESTTSGKLTLEQELEAIEGSTWQSKVLVVVIFLCRLVIAVTFIFSGFVKAIDPIGTQYKIEDYLTAIHLQGIIPNWVTLSTSVILAGLEFCIGILFLFAIRRRLMSKIVLFFMIIMTIITIWLAAANPIKDCGCFGDAIQLTNVQTLLKNIILLACTIIVARWPLKMIRFISKSNQWIVINYTIFFIFITSIYSLYLLPEFDFRPYHVGADIRKGMTIPPDAKQPKFETTFIMEKNGQRKEFTLDNYPDSTWKFIDSKTVQTEKGFEPEIHDFSIQDKKTGEDITREVIDRKGYTFLLIAPHLEQADDSNFGDIDQIYEYAEDNKIPFLCLTASNEEGMKHWQDITGAEYPFYITDETTLKTIVRSNPGLILLKNGIIIGKWSHNNLPTEEELSTPLNKAKMGQMQKDNIPRKILVIILWFVLPLVLLTIADRLWAWSRWIKEKENSNKIYQLLKQKRNEKENCSR